MTESQAPCTTVAFVRAGRPKTSNKGLGTLGRRFQEDLARLYISSGGTRSEEHRYGIVYYFVRGYDPANDADAGNVTKRVWDALEDHAYGDDHVVRYQVAGLIETGSTRDGEVAWDQLDLTDVPESTLELLLQLVGDGVTKHVVYVEIGPLKPSLFLFNLGKGPGQQS